MRNLASMRDRLRTEQAKAQSTACRIQRQHHEDQVRAYDKVIGVLEREGRTVQPRSAN